MAPALRKPGPGKVRQGFTGEELAAEDGSEGVEWELLHLRNVTQTGAPSSML